MTKTFKVGDRVKVITKIYGDYQYGLTGTVIEDDGNYPTLPLRVAYDKPDPKWGSEFNSYDHADLAPLSVTPSIAKDLALTPQAKSVLQHLEKHDNISPMEALHVHGIYRLSSCIHEIRKAGYTVSTVVKRDDHGHKYSRYSLDKKTTRASNRTPALVSVAA